MVGVNARQAGFDDLTAEALYDGVWANFSLLHAPRADVPGHLDQINRALKPDGVFHIAVKTGTGSERDSIGRMYTYFTEDELNGLLADIGMTAFERREGRDMGLSGEMADWVALLARG